MFLDQTHFGKLYMDICFLKSIVLWPYYYYYIWKVYHIWYCIWGNVWIFDMKNMSIFYLIFDKEIMDFMVYYKIWRCLSCLVMWEIDRKSLDKNKVENPTNFVEVRLFKVFLKLTGYKLCIWKEMYTCELYVVLTPCHMWFPDDHPIWFL